MLLASVGGYSQQQPMYAQYMFNGLAINPAYAGSHGSLSLTALSRHQWAGVEGAPTTQTLSAHSPVRNENIGLGMMIVRDNVGVTNQLSANFIYSYKIQLAKGVLSSGLQFSLNQYKISYSKLNINNDIAFGPDDVSKVNPNFGAGMYYASRLFYAGVSVPTLMETSVDDENPSELLDVNRHYFFHSGYVFTLNRDLKLKPNTLIKFVDGAPLSIDLNANLLVREVIWVGVSYRSFQSLGALFDIQVTDQLRIGYAYDFPAFSTSKGLNASAHEFMLHYNFTFFKSKSHSPRYF